MEQPVYMHVSPEEFGPYPYRLRPDARRRYPNVMPCPTSWDKCTAEQRAAFNAVEVVRAAPPELQPGESVREVTPAFVDGVLTQQWEVMPPEPPEVPECVEAHALRLVLNELNILGQVEILVQNHSDPRAVLAWQHAPYISRNSIMLQEVGLYLGLTKEQIDNIFITADNLDL